MSISRHAVLIVTNDLEMVETLRGLLGSEQSVGQAGSVKEAIAEARMDGTALVLLDSRVEGLDVGEFCLQLKNDPQTSRIPIMFLAPSDGAAASGLEQGASDYLVAPLEPVVAKKRILNYVDLGRCLEALRRFSLIDGVTGIANRRRFDEFLILEWRRNLRNRTPISIVFMDLDHFGAYTEHYGMGAGEDCLKRIASAFQDATQRPGDLVAIHSGGIFACVLPETDTLGAVSVAERMRAELATLAIPHAKSETAPILTMSVGTATCVPAEDTTPDDLVDSAGRSLREAKHAGGNRVEFGN